MSKSQSAAPEGQPAHSPKIRIHGVQSGSPKHAAIVDQFRARLGAFHERHQQQVKISGNSQYAAKAAWPGARAVYQNNNGQETITMVVDPLEEGGEEETITETPWEFALVDFIIRNVGQGAVHIAMFLNKPLTADEKAMTAETFLPVQGVTEHKQADVDKPLLALAYNAPFSQAVADNVDDPDFYASLRVDLRPFPFQVIEIDVYGFIEPYFQTGGTGEGGTVQSSELYGLVGHQFDEVNQSPGGWSGAAEGLLRIPTSLNPFGHDRVVATFPELGSKSFEYSNDTSDQGTSVSFSWSFVDGVQQWVAIEPVVDGVPYSVSPNDNPGAFAAVGPPQVTTTEYWDDGVSLKKLTGLGTYVDYGVSAGASTIVDTPPPTGSVGVTVSYAHGVAYYVPTWKFDKPAPVEIQAVCARNGNPWKVVSFRTGQPPNQNGRWEVPSTYPVRPPMKTLDGHFTIPSQDRDFDNEDFPFVHFGMPKMGTLKIDTKSGGVKFVPA